MYGRREQVQAHRFLVGRLVSAVLRTDPDSVTRPLRRTSVGLVGGVALALLAVVALVVIGHFAGANGDAWRKPGTLIVDQTTGTRYVLVNATLHPVLNYASARLLLGAKAPVARVKHKKLRGIPRGGAVGIPGAPDALPDPGASPAWTVCAGANQIVTLTIGAMPGLAPAAGSALLVRSGDDLYLVWRERRLRIAGRWVPLALGFDPNAAPAVNLAWLNALPAGPDIGAPAVERGGKGPVISGQQTVTGQLVSVADAVGQRSFVVVDGGLAPVTALVAALVAADPAGSAATLQVTPAQLAVQTLLPAPAWQADLPADLPVPMRLDNQSACVRWTNRSAALTLVPGLVAAGGADPVGTTRDKYAAARVTVTAGAGVLARTTPAPGVPGAGIYLVTEPGAKYPVADADAAAALGQPIESAEAVPSSMLALLPTGPVLRRTESNTNP